MAARISTLEDMQGDTEELPTRAARRRELAQMSRSQRRRAQRATSATTATHPVPRVPRVPDLVVAPEGELLVEGRVTRRQAVAPTRRTTRRSTRADARSTPRPAAETPGADEPRARRRRLLPVLLVANVAALSAAGALTLTGALPRSLEVVLTRDLSPSAPAVPTTPDVATPAADGSAVTPSVRPLDVLCRDLSAGRLATDTREYWVLVTAANGSDLDAWCADFTGASARQAS